jgi:hypothetical protein
MNKMIVAQAHKHFGPPGHACMNRMAGQQTA